MITGSTANVTVSQSQVTKSTLAEFSLCEISNVHHTLFFLCLVFASLHELFTHVPPSTA